MAVSFGPSVLAPSPRARFSGEAMMNCPNCGFDIEPNSVIQDSPHTATASPDSAESVLLVLKGTILLGIEKYSDPYPFPAHLSGACAKITASTLKALLVADEDAYAEYNSAVAETNLALDVEGGGWAANEE